LRAPIFRIIVELSNCFCPSRSSTGTTLRTTLGRCTHEVRSKLTMVLQRERRSRESEIITCSSQRSSPDNLTRGAPVLPLQPSSASSSSGEPATTSPILTVGASLFGNWGWPCLWCLKIHRGFCKKKNHWRPRAL
jgi:hypothetical protein